MKELRDCKYVYALYAIKKVKPQSGISDFDNHERDAFFYLNTSYIYRQPVWAAILKSFWYGRWSHSVESGLHDKVKRKDLTGKMNPSIIVYPNLFTAWLVNVFAGIWLLIKEVKWHIRRNSRAYQIEEANRKRKVNDTQWYRVDLYGNSQPLEKKEVYSEKEMQVGQRFPFNPDPIFHRVCKIKVEG